MAWGQLMPPQQLPLAVQLPDDETFETFHEGDNRTALKWLRVLPEKQAPLNVNEQLTWLSGPEGVGKSHLLHSLVGASSEASRVFYLPLKELSDVEPAAVLQGAEQASIICLDDIDRVTEDESWCYELFALINRVTDSEYSRLVMTAKQSALKTAVSLPDLQSRFQWATAFQLQPLTDEDKAQVLSLRAQFRGLELPDDVAAFMIQRLGRSMRELMSTLNELDKASITYQRRLTIPFIKKVLSV
ncbi:DnaA regulatory inactivator Hda [Idiomarina sp. X4]|uniref:DnaA regulatory inactivator Hda n=1 Tax=Idiomarina sp. X4 TaxID=2055892 RepID=UPI001E36D70A|nr:DnaA regulatory inactivator Hda [Idiomarina sp. X4]